MLTSEFLENLERAITVPTYQPRFTQVDLLALAYEEQKTTIVPMLLGIGQNYLLFKEEQEILEDTSIVSFPYRSVARAAKNIYYRLSDQDKEYQLTKYTLQQSNQWADSDKGNPNGFVLMDDGIRIFPIPDQDATIIFDYYIKPSKPVLSSRTATITAVGVDTVTVSSVPRNIVIGSVCDITKVRAGYKLVYLDKTVSNIASTVITLAGFDSSNPITGVSVGDSLSLALETSILQMPEEACDVLVQATAVRVLEALGVPDQLDMAQKQMARKVQAARELMAPRIEDQPAIIMHGHPLLEGYGYRPFPKVNVSDT